MVGLVDIAELNEKVQVRGKDIDVFGVSAQGLVYLISKYPQVADAINGGEVKAEALMKLGGDVVGAIIAAGTGAPGDAQSEEVARKLPLSDQAALIASILRLTLPDGIDPFVEKLSAIAASLGVKGSVADITEQATGSRELSKD